MLKIFKNSFKKAVQTWQKYYIFSVSFKQNKKKLLLLIPEKKAIEYSLCIILNC